MAEFLAAFLAVTRPLRAGIDFHISDTVRAPKRPGGER
jgi:hypothetical protein